jgi:hypothetical protein
VGKFSEGDSMQGWIKTKVCIKTKDKSHKKKGKGSKFKVQGSKFKCLKIMKLSIS